MNGVLQMQKTYNLTASPVFIELKITKKLANPSLPFISSSAELLEKQ